MAHFPASAPSAPLHPGARAALPGAVTEDNGKGAPRRLPPLVPVTLSGLTHTNLLYLVTHMSVAGGGEGKVSGSREIYSSDSPGICWLELVQPTELPKVWSAYHFAVSTKSFQMAHK